MPSEADAAYCREQVMRYDRDRFRTVLFAPKPCRDDLCALYAFNLEIARIRESVSEPMLGAMRLQWWRDTLDGAYRGETPRHAVAAPLAALIGERGLTRAHFDRLLDARARDFDDGGFETLEELTAYAEDTAGPPLLLAQELLGVTDARAETAARHLGAAWALTGLLRALPFRVRQGRETLPGNLMSRHGVDPRALRAFRADTAVRAAVAELAALAESRLGEAQAAACAVPVRARSPLLLSPLAGFFLRRLRRARFDPFDPDIAAPAPFAVARMAWWRWRPGHWCA